MKTQVIILGKEPHTQKKIEFSYVLDPEGLRVIAQTPPHSYSNIELICKNYVSGQYDLMFAYADSLRNLGRLYLGHFNDGVV